MQQPIFFPEETVSITTSLKAFRDAVVERPVNVPKAWDAFKLLGDDVIGLYSVFASSEAPTLDQSEAAECRALCDECEAALTTVGDDATGKIGDGKLLALFKTLLPLIIALLN